MDLILKVFANLVDSMILCARETSTVSNRGYALPTSLCSTIPFIATRNESGKRVLKNEQHHCSQLLRSLSPVCPGPSLPLSACPALRLQRKMLPELGIRTDPLSKAGLNWVSNGQRIKPQSRLSFLSSATLPSIPLPVFISLCLVL